MIKGQGQNDINAILSLIGQIDDEPKQEETTPEQVAQPEPKEIIIEGKNEVGSIIEFEGKQWLVSLCENETGLTPSDVRDEYDEYLPRGWHSWLVEVQAGNKALLVVSDLLKSGEARFTSSTTVLFKDERYAYFLRDLAYSDEIGVYERQ